MAGRHSKRRARTRIPGQRGPNPAVITDVWTLGRSRWRRSSAPVPAQRRAGIDVVDVVTKLAHKVNPDELLAGRSRGEYLGFCGARFQAASMVDPGHGQCLPCQQRVTS
jgi:hypothetical protein